MQNVGDMEKLTRNMNSSVRSNSMQLLMHRVKDYRPLLKSCILKTIKVLIKVAVF